MGKARRVVMDESDLLAWYEIDANRWNHGVPARQYIAVAGDLHFLHDEMLTLVDNGIGGMVLKISHSNGVWVTINARRR